MPQHCRFTPSQRTLLGLFNFRPNVTAVKICEQVSFQPHSTSSPQSLFSSNDNCLVGFNTSQEARLSFPSSLKICEHRSIINNCEHNSCFNTCMNSWINTMRQHIAHQSNNI